MNTQVNDIYAIPIYQRVNLDSLSTFNKPLIVHHSKNRLSFEESYSELFNILSFKQYNHYKEIRSRLWRMIDSYFAEGLDKSEDIDIVDQVFFLGAVNPQFAELLDRTLLNYRKRCKQLSDKYIADDILDYVAKSLKTTKSEQNIINWAEENIPGVTRKLIAAIINKNAFISLSYLLPINAVYTDSEKQKLYKFRKIIFNKLHVIQEKRFNFSNRQSPKLNYTKSDQIIYNILPIQNILEIRSEIAQLSTEIQQQQTHNNQLIIYLRKLNQLKQKCNNYHHILQLQHQINKLNDIIFISVNKLLDLRRNKIKIKFNSLAEQKSYILDNLRT